MFQTLLQKWQEQLNTNWSVNYEYNKNQQLIKPKYERKEITEEPSILVNILHSRIVDI